MKRLKYLVPKRLRAWLRDRYDQTQKGMLVLDRVTDWSVLRRIRPYRPEFGRRRGKCIDRVYIEEFLATYESSIRGCVAEIGSNEYTRQFGGTQVEHSDILDINEQNRERTMTIDLAETESVPENVFDCIICAQTLFQIFDYASASRSLYRMLKPRGVLLATVPGISPVVRGGLLAGAGSDWWRFTALSAKRAFAEVFDDENVVVNTYGNVLTATAFLQGLVQEELTREELEYHDPDYEVTIGIKATKATAE